MMTIICAWCGANLGTKPGGDGETHGICGDCSDRLRRQHGLQPSSLRAQKLPDRAGKHGVRETRGGSSNSNQ